MARIRTIKPEFWVDEKVAQLTLGARLLFIGLWSFADDQGYVEDKPRRIRMQIFPDDQFDVAPWLDELAALGLIVRYDSSSGPVLHIRNWDRHQRVDKPSAPRIDPDSLTLSASPREGSRVIHDDSSNSREDSCASLATEGKGSGPGREGKGREWTVPPSAGADAPRRELAKLDESPTAQTLVGEWVDHCPKKPPGSVVAQIGKHLRAMLAEGIDPGDVRAGLVAWHAKGLHPSTLPSVVNEVMNAGAARPRASPNGHRSTTDDRVQAALALGKRLQEEIDLNGH